MAITNASLVGILRGARMSFPADHSLSGSPSVGAPGRLEFFDKPRARRRENQTQRGRAAQLIGAAESTDARFSRPKGAREPDGCYEESKPTRCCGGPSPPYKTLQYSSHFGQGER